ncbi:MAG TPA: hypothetical protein VHP58_05235 [Alphaproteobacteria bacterium]|nr:hypothetical protein [Alphaproteobacteria bacterium]
MKTLDLFKMVCDAHKNSTPGYARHTALGLVRAEGLDALNKAQNTREADLRTYLPLPGKLMADVISRGWADRAQAAMRYPDRKLLTAA